MRRAEAAHKFEVDRAKSRADRAVGGSRVMNDARTRRARMNEDAVRRDAAPALRGDRQGCSDRPV